MAKLTLAVMLEGLNGLTREELTILNTQLIVISKEKRREVQVEAASVAVSNWRIGDVIRFVKPGRGRGAGVNYFKFKNMNRAGTGMQGPSCNADGISEEYGTKWTIPCTEKSLTLVMRAGKKV